MANILKKPSHRARLGYNGHDMSRRVLFTSSTGHLIPVLYDYLEPGTKIRVNDALFTRTQPLNTCAFVRCTEHIDYFFVPMEQIDAYFGQAFFGIFDEGNTNNLVYGSSNTSMLRVSLPTAPPLFNLTWWKDAIGLPSAGTFGDTIEDTVLTMSAPNSLQLLPIDENGDIINDSTTAVDHYSLYLMAPFDNTYTNDIYTYTDINNMAQYYGSYTGFTPFGTPWLSDHIRLASMLGYGERYMCTTADDITSVTTQVQTEILPRLFAVYQKIWYDYYRLSDYTRNNPYAYNLNYAFLNGTYDRYMPEQNSAMGNQDMFTLRYRPFKKDYFTNIQPDPLFSSNDVTYGYASGSSALFQLNDYLLGGYGIQLQQTGSPLDFPGVYSSEYDGNTLQNNYPTHASSSTNNSDSIDVINSYYTSGTGSQPTAPFSVQQLRSMFAYERMLAITQRAAKNYDAQVEAHYGFSTPKGISDKVYYIGGHSTRLQIGEVVATAAGSSGSGDYDTSVLGQIGGRGLAASGKQRTIKFTAPCHGYLMAVYSCLPEIEYRNFGFDKRSFAVGINQFPRVEYDKLGMQPLFIEETYGNIYSLSSQVLSNNVLGWQYRYEQYKQSYDIVCGGFNYTLRDWSSGIVFGQFANDVEFASAFYCPPTYLDSVFAVGYNPTYETFKYSDEYTTNGYLIATDIEASLADSSIGTNGYAGTADADAVYAFNNFSLSPIFERDPFLHSIDFKYYKVDKYSTYGLPNI